ncbi:uncharacterized protein LACBIDRAFT_305037 [Laccaria bicolor S238N-H82]|uniref:Predicted protein n=1 Tax=Laccaria bicolor (strain S238N-H82 / ATCC MYA-4686) TaxID=486041 RepID=B0CTA8_LACBS|nr:uncharacterized protein LACBIDRAFT_305037 [Laccaria bicolor S238N-H82]EDR14462.1 predicted protein [Laccaria bicolor S238N-H82]|eukprot:XP_001875021.1 predicted protein [Laccaria bicolor S238N-H82]
MEEGLPLPRTQFLSDQDGPHAIRLTVAPIFEIPNEIFALIFWMSTDSEHIENQRTLIASSQVCRRWRSVIFGYPALWGRVIHFTDPLPRLRQLLQRSKPGPIDVGRVDLQVYLGHIRMLEILSESSSRIRTFNVRLSNRERNYDLVSKQFFEQPAPLLEFMSVSLTPSTSVVQGPLFQGDAPYLRRLHLSNCSIRFALSMPILARLTELSARNIAPVVAPSASMWLMNLLEMPNLRWLSIIDSIAPHQTFPPTQVHLPNLTMLTLSGKLCDCVFLLDYITAPSLIGMRLNCNTVEPGHYFTQLLDNIKRKLSTWPLKADESPQIILLEDGRIFVGNSRRFSSLDVDAWNVCEVASLRSGCHAPDRPICILDLAWDDVEDDIAFCCPLLSAIQPVFKVATSLVLWLIDDNMRAESISEKILRLRVCFHSFEDLHTLHLTNQSSKFILQFLSLPTSPDIIFPSLKTLCFFLPGFHDQEDHFDALLSFVQIRAQIQQALTNIVVSSDANGLSQITQRQTDILKKHGVEVEFNNTLYEQYL